MNGFFLHLASTKKNRIGKTCSGLVSPLPIAAQNQKNTWDRSLPFSSPYKTHSKNHRMGCLSSFSIPLQFQTPSLSVLPNWTPAIIPFLKNLDFNMWISIFFKLVSFTFPNAFITIKSEHAGSYDQAQIYEKGLRNGCVVLLMRGGIK